MDESSERWLPVDGYDGKYEVSDLGRVRSFAKKNGHVDRQVAGYVLKCNVVKGYLRAVLYDSDGAPHNHAVQRLVLEAFVGPAPEGMESCHWDADRLNNTLGNLRWGTKSDNTMDQVRVGRHHIANRRVAQTHCKRGHEFTDENTHWIRRASGNTSRSCVACERSRYERTPA